MVEILMPYAEAAEAASWRGAPRLSTLDGRTVGIVNNSWRCMDLITSELSALLTSDFGVRAVVEEKISAAQMVPDDRLLALSESCDAVVVGIGN